MAQPRKTSLIALALALSGGLLATTTSAQRPQAVPPTYDASPNDREQSPDPIQLYSLPAGAEESAPSTMPPPSPPSPYPYAAPRPAWENDRPDNRDYDWSPPSSSLQVQTAQGIRYMSGGIGESERAEMEAWASQFNLRLLFAIRDSGNYLADVGVRILDPSGAVVLSAESRGPWFFVQLPADVYTVEVSAQGQSQRQTAHVGQGQSQLNFYWR